MRNTNGFANLTPARVGVGIAFALLLAIVLIKAFAPEKPPETPPSRIQYEAKGDRGPYAENWSQEGSAPLNGGGQEENTPAEEAGTEADRFLVYGTVTREADGKPVVNAEVTFERKATQDEFDKWKRGEMENLVPAGDSSEPPSGGTEATWSLLEAKRSARTDEQGQYAVRVPIIGAYRAMAWTPSLAAEGKGVDIAEDTKKLRVDFVLNEGGSISGRVTESGTGRGAPGISIGGGPWQKTDADGRYRIAGLPAGTYDIYPVIDDAPYRFLGPPPRRQIALKERQDVTNVDFVVEPAGRVWGYVWDAEHKPVKDTFVLLCNSDSVISQFLESAMQQRPPLGGRSDAEGLYSIVGVPLNREMRIFAQPNDFAAQLSDPFVATPRRREVRVDLFLDNGTTVTGRVLDTLDRQPVRNAEVQCIPGLVKFTTPLETPGGFRDTKSDSEGRFTIAHLPPGQHTLYAVAQGYKVSLTGESVFCEGQDNLFVDLWLAPVDAGEYSVYGTVMDSEGRAVEGAKVELAGLAEGFAAHEQEVRTDAKGYYEFLGVDAGMLMLHVGAEGYAPVSLDDIQFDAPTNITLEAAGSVTGRVLVYETNEAPGSFSVRVMPASLDFGLSDLDGLNGKDFNGSDGSFTLPAPAGSYVVNASASELAPGQTSATVQAGKTTDVGVIYLRSKGARISGRVVVSGGRSAAGATVTLGRTASSFAELQPLIGAAGGQMLSTGSDGSFEFDRLGAGVYVVTARMEGYAEGRSTPIALQEGQEFGGVEVVLGTGGTIRGSVKIGGEPAAGAAITAVGPGAKRLATSDRNSQYVLENLPPGTYLVSAVAPEQVMQGVFTPVHATAEVRNGQVTLCDLGEGAGATLEGYCSPPPPANKMGFALLRLGGAGDDVASLNLRDLMSWFNVDNPNPAAASVLGLAPVERADGYFRIENAPEGQYVLDVYYVSITDVMGSSSRRAASIPVNITGTDTIELQIGTSG